MIDRQLEMEGGGARKGGRERRRDEETRKHDDGDGKSKQEKHQTSSNVKTHPLRWASCDVTAGWVWLLVQQNLFVITQKQTERVRPTTFNNIYSSSFISLCRLKSIVFLSVK